MRETLSVLFEGETVNNNPLQDLRARTNFEDTGDFVLLRKVLTIGDNWIER